MSIDAVVIAGDPVRADLKRFAWVNVKDNIYKRAGIVGFIIPVVLLAEYFKGIAALLKTGRYGDDCRTACAVLRDTSIVTDCAAFIRNHSGNIFVAARLCAGIVDRKALPCFNSCCRCFGGKAAACIFQRQLPFRSGCADRRQFAIHRRILFAAGCGRGKEDSAQV